MPTSYRISEFDNDDNDADLLHRFPASCSLTNKRTTAAYVSTIITKPMSIEDIKAKLEWYNKMTDLNVTASPVRGKATQECMTCGYNEWMKPEVYFSCFDKDGLYHKWCADCMAKQVGGHYTASKALQQARVEREAHQEETDSTATESTATESSSSSSSSSSDGNYDNCVTCRVVLEESGTSFCDGETAGFRCSKHDCCSGVVYCLECAHGGGGEFCNGCSSFLCNKCCSNASLKHYDDVMYCSRACGEPKRRTNIMPWKKYGDVETTSGKTTGTSGKSKKALPSRYEFDYSSDEDGSDLYFDA